MNKRKIDVLVLSDMHLGAYGCKAKELHHYLKSVDPQRVILNGDIIDIWNFKKWYFPEYHMKVVRQLIKLASRVPVYYITGNHDEALRKYSEMSMGHLQLCDRLSLNIDGQQYLFFHGDAFDASINCAKWLAKIGGWSYDFLILINNVINAGLSAIGRPRMSLSKRIKNSVKRAVRYVNDFEMLACEFGAREGCDVVVCGHIHQPQMRRVQTKHGQVSYFNSGDWVENLTALEYAQGRWQLYTYEPESFEIERIMEKWSASGARLTA